MAFVVEMVRGQPYTRSYQEYSCSAWAWRWMVDLGKALGWQAAGAIAAPPRGYSSEGYRSVQDFEYIPDEWRYAMQVTEHDARAWASALARATTEDWAWASKSWPTILTDAAPATTFRRLNAPCREVVKGFIEFAVRGEFRFALDD